MDECCDSCQVRKLKAWQGLAVTRKKRKDYITSFWINNCQKKRKEKRSNEWKVLWSFDTNHLCHRGENIISPKGFVISNGQISLTSYPRADIYNSCSIHRIKQQFEIPFMLLIILHLSWSSCERSILHLLCLTSEKLKLYFASILPPCDGKVYVTQPPRWPKEENEEPN